MSTDKSRYSQSERIKMEIKVENTSDKAVTLYFASGCLTDYSIGTFNSSIDVTCTAEISQYTINPHDSHIFTNEHSPATYRIPVGNQTLKVYLNASSKNTFTGAPLDYTLSGPAIKQITII